MKTFKILIEELTQNQKNEVDSYPVDDENLSKISDHILQGIQKLDLIHYMI